MIPNAMRTGSHEATVLPEFNKEGNMRRNMVWAGGAIGLLMLIGLKADLPFSMQGGPAAVAAAESKTSASSSDLDVITIDNKDYKSKRRGPVTFSHLKHAKDDNVSCWDCHHEFEDNGNVWVPWSETAKCSDCHDPGKGDAEMVGLQKAYHVNCKTCHEKLAKQNKPTGPYRGCFGCHEKEKP